MWQKRRTDTHTYIISLPSLQLKLKITFGRVDFASRWLRQNILDDVYSKEFLAILLAFICSVYLESMCEPASRTEHLYSNKQIENLRTNSNAKSKRPSNFFFQLLIVYIYIYFLLEMWPFLFLTLSSLTFSCLNILV